MNPCFCVLMICVCVFVCTPLWSIRWARTYTLSYNCRNLSPNNCKVVKTPPMLGLKPIPTICKVFELLLCSWKPWPNPNHFVVYSNLSYAHGTLHPHYLVVYSNLFHYAREKLDPTICILYPTFILLVVTPDNHNSLLWYIGISFCKCGLLSKLLERVLGSI